MGVAQKRYRLFRHSVGICVRCGLPRESWRDTDLCLPCTRDDVIRIMRSRTRTRKNRCARCGELGHYAKTCEKGR